MSIQDYVTSQRIAAEVNTLGPGNEFFSLLMAAIRFADTDNLERLQESFPEIVIELKKRYNAPGGALNDKEMEWVKRYLKC
jgi:hypothetical protein